tara:strand:+ start:526 stop:942 length:417 start_codon:yes stop_codon:yes gene_type:complete
MAQVVSNSLRSDTGQPTNEMIEMLVNIGVDSNVAKVLVALSDGQFQSSTNLQKICKLRQPEISMAMQQLLSTDMVAYEPLKSGGRGRPIHRYSLNGQFTEIIQPFIVEAEEHISQLADDLARLEFVSNDLATAAMSDS